LRVSRRARRLRARLRRGGCRVHRAVGRRARGHGRQARGPPPDDRGGRARRARLGGTVESDAEVERLAASFGFPVMLKAAGGGGGKGMRLVATRDELKSALRGARSEAKSAFGDDRV